MVKLPWTELRINYQLKPVTFIKGGILVFFYSKVQLAVTKTQRHKNKVLKDQLKLISSQRDDQVTQLSEIYNCEIDKELRNFIFSNAHKSRSQLFQDLIVLFHNPKQQGYFVEFGASDGVYLSNTYLLELEYGWHGILAEPGRIWHDDLGKNRKAIISHKCISSHTGEKLVFNQTSDPMLSTIDSFSGGDHWAESRTSGRKYVVESLSLNDLLIKHDSPIEIDYLSVDTEGSEYSILANLNFDRYKFRFISVEHNFSDQRENIYQLLTSHSYKRILTEISKWDDWYIPV